ncbi:LuxR C-terminal-related transcriptional regulator [Actinoplanes sp. NPDC049118]|uniref:helix-turn-helix transcriptional regulator n=1 Tax=Actinoplanes sp. NPDC049118 TaxID=3155769 RepID=UPI00340ACF2B
MTWNGSDEKHEYGTAAIREPELGALRRALARCGPAGRWIVAEVAGEPGMGKSTLLAGFGRYAADAGCRVLPWRAGSPASWQPAPGEPGAHGGPGAGPPISSLAEVLRSVAGPGAGRRQVLIVDDVHRADPASAELLAELVRHPPLGPVLLVLAHRPRQLTGDLAAALATAADAGEVRRVALRPLTPAESATLLPPSTPPHRRSDLHEAAEGNPLYLLGSAGTPGAVPKRVLAALEPELLAGSPIERLVVWSAAVAGDPADPELIAAVAECDPAAVYRALDRIVADDLLRPAPSGAGFRFRHEVVRAAAYASAPSGWLLAAHGRAAAALRDRGAAAADRADHLERCAAPGDEDAVETLSRAAAGAAYRAPADAARWFTAALRLLPVGPATAERRTRLLLRCARALGLAGRHGESRAHLHRLLAELPAADAGRRAEAAVLAARAERLLGRHAEADALLRSELGALRAAVAAGPGPHAAGSEPDASEPDAELAGALAAGAMLRGDAATARRWSAEVLDHAVGGAPRIAASALLALADLMTDPAGPADAGPDSDGARSGVAARLGGSADAGPDSDGARSGVAARLGGSADAEPDSDGARSGVAARLDEAADLVDAMVDDRLVAVLDDVRWLAEAELAAERIGDALRHTDRMLAVAGGSNRFDILAALHGIAGRARLLGGDLPRAAESLDRAAADARRSGSPARLAEATACLAWSSLWQGDAAAAARLAERAHEQDGAVASRLVGGAAVGDWVRLGDDASAADRLGGELETSGGDPLVRVRWLELAAMTCADRGFATSASACAASARRLAAGSPGRRVRGYAALAQSHALLGADPAAAADAARLAADLLAAAGDQLGARGARLRLDAALSAPDDGAKAGGLAALTARETEVVTLVAEGLTNKEIAHRLYLSPGTVSIHVGRVYAKLGVSRRAAAAARLVGAGLAGPGSASEPGARG